MLDDADQPGSLLDVVDQLLEALADDESTELETAQVEKLLIPALRRGLPPGRWRVPHGVRWSLVRDREYSGGARPTEGTVLRGALEDADDPDRGFFIKAYPRIGVELHLDSIIESYRRNEHYSERLRALAKSKPWAGWIDRLRESLALTDRDQPLWLYRDDTVAPLTSVELEEAPPPPRSVLVARWELVSNARQFDPASVPADRAALIALAACHALALLHLSGGAHRDVKEGNLLLLRGTESVRVVDLYSLFLAYDAARKERRSTAVKPSSSGEIITTTDFVEYWTDRDNYKDLPFSGAQGVDGCWPWAFHCLVDWHMMLQAYRPCGDGDDHLAALFDALEGQLTRLVDTLQPTLEAYVADEEQPADNDLELLRVHIRKTAYLVLDGMLPQKPPPLFPDGVPDTYLRKAAHRTGPARRTENMEHSADSLKEFAPEPREVPSDEALEERQTEREEEEDVEPRGVVITDLKELLKTPLTPPDDQHRKKEDVVLRHGLRELLWRFNLENPRVLLVAAVNASILVIVAALMVYINVSPGGAMPGPIPRVEYVEKKGDLPRPLPRAVVRAALKIQRVNLRQLAGKKVSSRGAATQDLAPGRQDALRRQGLFTTASKAAAKKQAIRLWTGKLLSLVGKKYPGLRCYTRPAPAGQGDTTLAVACGDLKRRSGKACRVTAQLKVKVVPLPAGQRGSVMFKETEHPEYKVWSPVWPLDFTVQATVKNVAVAVRTWRWKSPDASVTHEESTGNARSRTWYWSTKGKEAAALKDAIADLSVSQVLLDHGRRAVVLFGLSRWTERPFSGLDVPYLAMPYKDKPRAHCGPAARPTRESWTRALVVKGRRRQLIFVQWTKGDKEARWVGCDESRHPATGGLQRLCLIRQVRVLSNREHVDGYSLTIDGLKAPVFVQKCGELYKRSQSQGASR